MKRKLMKTLGAVLLAFAMVTTALGATAVGSSNATDDRAILLGDPRDPFGDKIAWVVAPTGDPIEPFASPAVVALGDPRDPFGRLIV